MPGTSAEPCARRPESGWHAVTIGQTKAGRRGRWLGIFVVAVGALAVSGCDNADPGEDPAVRVRPPGVESTRETPEPVTATAKLPGRDNPVVLPRARAFLEIVAGHARADEPWATSLGPRFPVVVQDRGTRLELDVYPYARVHFPAPFVYVPPSQVLPTGSRVKAGWARVPVGIRYSFESAGISAKDGRRAK